jgi:predicted ATP-dependent endonuclease of OLD family
MNIDCVDIQNFRKLKKCRIDFSKEETVLVGANNSGKTTAMDALILFLKKVKFSTRVQIPVILTTQFQFKVTT